LPQAENPHALNQRQCRFPDLPSELSLPAIDHEMLGRWTTAAIFQRSNRQAANEPLWTCYDGPAAASGMPGIHHVPARVTKDLYLRFKTMQGFHVPVRSGWDCHGLPVEVAVESELGLSGKTEIEAYGVDQFNARCQEFALRHVAALSQLTERLGCWVDPSQAYQTMDVSYIESVWWSLKRIFTAGMLVRDYRVDPYCPRCETPLASHELGQPDVFQRAPSPVVTVRFRLLTRPAGGDPQLADADLLVQTAAPWTLVSNTAIAVNPAQLYAIARRAGSSDRVVVADHLFARLLGEGWHVATRITGADLAGATYRPVFSLVEIPGAHQVVTGSFVTTTDGTGLVHLAPAFGASALATCRAHGFPIVNPIRPDGHFEESVPLVGGVFFRAADPILIASLADRGLLFAVGQHERGYPHCWRCRTPLLNYAMASWYIRTTAIRDRLIAEDEKISWQPPGSKCGKFDGWLRGNADWTLSRTRYWGTPLPLWECGRSHVTCVGSLAELSELAGRDLSGLDPHRPGIDDVVITCSQCGAAAHRIPEVIDVGYDAGAMPFAQHGAPLLGAAEFKQAFPAQLVTEGTDQGHGWFYSMLVIGTLAFGRAAYETALCLGTVVDERGRQMSRGRGNVVQPLPLLERHGADAVRWFVTVVAPGQASQQVSDAAIAEITRKILRTYFRAVSFFVRHANAAAARGVTWRPAPDRPPAPDCTAAPDRPPAPDRTAAPDYRPVLDKWLLSELHAVVIEVTAALEAFNSAAAGRRIATFVNDLSSWYLRMSRSRFLAGPGTPAGAAAFSTLHECLETLSRLMAPLTPFLSDYVWTVLRVGNLPDSVHLASWPVADASLIDERLADQMTLARAIVGLGHSARTSALIKRRQPLARALVSTADFTNLPVELRALIADELNVATLSPLATASIESVEYAVRPGFRALGRRFGKDTPAVAAAIESADATGLAASLNSTGMATVQVGTDQVSLTRAEVRITQAPSPGWAIASANGETVALDVTITPDAARGWPARGWPANWCA
jgi:isoleucyl-tRNA synthetase